MTYENQILAVGLAVKELIAFASANDRAAFDRLAREHGVPETDLDNVWAGTRLRMRAKE